MAKFRKHWSLANYKLIWWRVPILILCLSLFRSCVWFFIQAVWSRVKGFPFLKEYFFAYFYVFLIGFKIEFTTAHFALPKLLILLKILWQLPGTNPRIVCFHLRNYITLFLHFLYHFHTSAFLEIRFKKIEWIFCFVICLDHCLES